MPQKMLILKSKPEVDKINQIVLKARTKSLLVRLFRARAVSFMTIFISARCASLAERFYMLGNCNAIS